MDQTTAPPIATTADPHAHPGKGGHGTTFWIIGIILILLAVTVGKSIEGQLEAGGMPNSGAGEASPAQLAALVFAFAFPLGFALCAMAVMHPRTGTGLASIAAAIGAALTVTAPVLVPLLLGRELISYHFGAGGIAITVAALGCFWFLGRLRRGIPVRFTPAVDLATLGLLCFTASAWNLCGSAAMPSFLLMPERLIELQSLPFAIGQMKSVLAQLVAGWTLMLAAAMLAAMRMAPTSKAF